MSVIPELNNISSTQLKLANSSMKLGTHLLGLLTQPAVAGARNFVQVRALKLNYSGWPDGTQVILMLLSQLGLGLG